jgi:hypothetical protein
MRGSSHTRTSTSSSRGSPGPSAMRPSDIGAASASMRGETIQSSTSFRVAPGGADDAPARSATRSTTPSSVPPTTYHFHSRPFTNTIGVNVTPSASASSMSRRTADSTASVPAASARRAASMPVAEATAASASASGVACNAKSAACAAAKASVPPSAAAASASAARRQASGCGDEGIARLHSGAEREVLDDDGGVRARGHGLRHRLDAGAVRALVVGEDDDANAAVGVAERAAAAEQVGRRVRPTGACVARHRRLVLRPPTRQRGADAWRRGRRGRGRRERRALRRTAARPSGPRAPASGDRRDAATAAATARLPTCAMAHQGQKAPRVAMTIANPIERSAPAYAATRNQAAGRPGDRDQPIAPETTTANQTKPTYDHGTPMPGTRPHGPSTNAPHPPWPEQPGSP